MGALLLFFRGICSKSYTNLTSINGNIKESLTWIDGVSYLHAPFLLFWSHVFLRCENATCTPFEPRPGQKSRDYIAGILLIILYPVWTQTKPTWLHTVWQWPSFISTWRKCLHTVWTQIRPDKMSSLILILTILIKGRALYPWISLFVEVCLMIYFMISLDPDHVRHFDKMLGLAWSLFDSWWALYLWIGLCIEGWTVAVGNFYNSMNPNKVQKISDLICIQIIYR